MTHMPGLPPAWVYRKHLVSRTFAHEDIAASARLQPVLDSNAMLSSYRQTTGLYEAFGANMLVPRVSRLGSMKHPRLRCLRTHG